MNRTSYYEDLEHKWNEGWQLDLEYILPRVVFRKGGSTCFMYDFKDFDGHLKTCGLTTLEYLEGKSFYRDNCILLLKAVMKNRPPAEQIKVARQLYESHSLNLTLTKEINKHA